MADILDLAIMVAVAFVTFFAVALLLVAGSFVFDWWADRNRIRWDGTHWITDRDDVVVLLDDRRRP